MAQIRGEVMNFETEKAHRSDRHFPNQDASQQAGQQASQRASQPASGLTSPGAQPNHSPWLGSWHTDQNDHSHSCIRRACWASNARALVALQGPPKMRAPVVGCREGVRFLDSVLGKVGLVAPDHLDRLGSTVKGTRKQEAHTRSN